MDIHGDHLVSCNFNQPQLRHNILRDALAKELCEHHVMVRQRYLLVELGALKI